MIKSDNIYPILVSRRKPMNTKQQLDSILEKWDLLKHPFYQAWSDGTLPVEALKVYASEYGAFINTLENGWETLGDQETAEEEKEHAELWEQFAIALKTEINIPQITQTKELLETSQTLFASQATTLGAMYAFEAQQPATAKSKLEGLKTHYSLPAEVEPYFEEHATNWHESEKILGALDKLSPADQEQAIAACAQMAESLWNALTGIHEISSLN
jgi:pyrroloquinoline-quinone synthase